MSDSVWPHRRQPTRLPCPWDSPGKNTGVGCHFLLQCMKVKNDSEVAQSCLTLSDPHGLQPTRLLHAGDFPGKSTGVGCVQLKQREFSGTAPFLVRRTGHCWWLHRTAAWFSYLAAVCLGWGQHVSSFRSCREASLVPQPVKNLPAVQETQVQFLGWEDPLKGMATHSSILAWRTAWTEEPGVIRSMELQSLT